MCMGIQYSGPGSSQRVNGCPWTCEVPSNGDYAVAYARDLALRTNSIEFMILSQLQFTRSPLLVCE